MTPTTPDTGHGGDRRFDVDNLIAAARAADAAEIAAHGRVLRTMVDDTVVAYRAFEIGVWETMHDNHAKALRWLRIAVDSDIEEAEPLLQICAEVLDSIPQRRDAAQDERDDRLAEIQVELTQKTDVSTAAVTTPIYDWLIARMHHDHGELSRTELPEPSESQQHDPKPAEPCSLEFRFQPGSRWSWTSQRPMPALLQTACDAFTTDLTPWPCVSGAFESLRTPGGLVGNGWNGTARQLLGRVQWAIWNTRGDERTDPRRQYLSRRDVRYEALKIERILQPFGCPGADDAYVRLPDLDLYVPDQRHGDDPGAGSALVRAARVAELNGDLARAERLLRVAATGWDPNALIMLAWLRHQAGDHHEANLLLRQAAEATAASPALLDHETPLRRNACHDDPCIQSDNDRDETELIG
ncbi:MULTISPECIES: tetratricopeptide repeat protein [Amycolatopsis]|uniref:Tetratricopeptide repeat protein n=1 Tax=Amycolatopsis bullii TaxID=941987 RepID=A0ABQ3KNS0_9PSEU|nr:hypothetical protein [Amycolatopsis bullii]GHG41166.1 hypothetical protein GCM10017567_73320 [Amycolatopsis bullii]